MNDRNMLEPDRAFAQTLGGLTRRLDALDRRGTWPGAVHASITGPTVPQPSQDIAAPPAYPIPFQILTLSLDPGRWVLFASTSVILAPDSPTDYRQLGEVGARLAWQGAQRFTEATANGPGREANLWLALEAKSKTPITATLGIYAGYVPGVDPPGTFWAFAGTLIAFPG